MPDRRPLPLVTADGPVCHPECPFLVRKYDYDLCETVAYLCELGSQGSVCHPDEHAAWLREQERSKRTCGRCDYTSPSSTEGRLVCGAWGSSCAPDESCSRFEERSTSPTGPGRLRDEERNDG